jgi:signal transduction histidine kinase
VARLARKDLEEVFESLDLAVLAEEMVESVRPAFESASVSLKAETKGGPFRMHGSPRLLEQAVANLLDNALRFTPSGGKVALTLCTAAPGRLTLEVSDSGPGAALLSRSDSTETAQGTTNVRGQEGTGLGLLVVNNVVRAHGGTVQARASEWGGACFCIELPADSEGVKSPPQRRLNSSLGGILPGVFSGQTGDFGDHPLDAGKDG